MFKKLRLHKLLEKGVVVVMAVGSIAVCLMALFIVVKVLYQ